MYVGEIVTVRLDEGRYATGQVIEIHGDIVRVAGLEEIRIVQGSGREPLGIGFRVQDVATMKKAKVD
jgi:hypothetical protein